MKKLLFSFLTLGLLSCVGFGSSLVYADLQEDVTGRVQEIIPKAGSPDQDLNYIDIAKTAQFWVFVFIGIIAVAYIIYIGAKLLWAPGSTEEMTTALKSLAYVVV